MGVDVSGLFKIIWLKSIHTFIVTVFTASASIRVSARNASLYIAVMIFCAQPYLKPCFMCPFYILSTCPSKGLCTALVLSYFEGTADVHCYTSCTLSTLHCSKVSFLQCGHMKRYNKIFTKMWGVYSLLWDTVFISDARMAVISAGRVIKNAFWLFAGARVDKINH